jgi:hypothetical protein
VPVTPPTVTDSHRTFKKQYQTGNEIGKDLLQSETQANSHCRDQPLHIPPPKTDKMECQNDSNNDQYILKDGLNGIAGARVERQTLQDGEFQQTRKVPSGKKCDRQGSERQNEINQRHPIKLLDAINEFRIHTALPQFDPMKGTQCRQNIVPDDPILEL